MKILSKIAIKYFSEYFEPLKDILSQSGINTLYEKYIEGMLLYSFLISFGTTAYIFALFEYIIKFNFAISIISAILSGLTVFFIALTAYHSYPFKLLEAKRRGIESNLPFAINYMAAVAESGVPPYIMFKLISDAKEYGEISKSCKKIIRNVNVFGMDITRAIKEVANKTPSEPFRRFLYGIISSIESGGDLNLYLKTSAQQALFDYRLKREKYLSALSTYADFYTAILIAAPLFFISILSVMSLIGGKVVGMDIPSAMKLGVYVFIPILNVLFLLFLQFTQPEI